MLGGDPGARKTTLLHYSGCKTVELQQAFFVHVTFEMPVNSIVACRPPFGLHGTPTRRERHPRVDQPLVTH